MWMAAFHDAGTIAGREFAAGIRLRSSHDMTVKVGLARHGSTEFEGVFRQVVLSAGEAQEVSLRKSFRARHSALRVQVEVVTPPAGGTARLGMDSIYLIETPASVRQRVVDAQLTLSTANRLYREHDYAATATINLILHSHRPLPMYAENAQMAAEKLGLDSPGIVAALM